MLEEKYKCIDTRLREYKDSDYYGFHMPGHKRNIEQFGHTIPYGMDITEIEGFDDLHHCEGIILEAQKRAARVFQAEETFFLINGSTVGNIAAIMSVTNRGDKILIARNNHKSVYNAVFLNGLEPIYIYPQFDRENTINGEISIEDMKELLWKEKDIKAIVIVSPTYDGVLSDIEGFSRLAQQYQIPLIVDEAHGAHLGMHEYFPENANQLGADIVIHSVHKTLPSLTQTGLLHVNGSIVNREILKRYLKMLQSSSPSYVLLSSIDRCVDIVDTQGVALFKQYVTWLSEMREMLKNMKYLSLIETEHFDFSKILISTRETSITSRMLYTILLEKYHLQMEMCGANYVTAMTSIGDTKEGFRRLTEALLEIDRELDVKGNEKNTSIEIIKFPYLRQAKDGEQGSEWFYYLYPPGIPFVVPGEVITEEIQKLMSYYEKMGFTIQKG